MPGASRALKQEMEMFELLERAGLAPADLARLVGVSRTAVHHWQHRGVKPCKWVQPRVTKVLDAVELALEAGTLPLSPDLGRRRVKVLVEVISEQLKRRKATKA